MSLLFAAAIIVRLNIKLFKIPGVLHNQNMTPEELESSGQMQIAETDGSFNHFGSS